jgi:hypothetical protein
MQPAARCFQIWGSFGCRAIPSLTKRRNEAKSRKSSQMNVAASASASERRHRLTPEEIAALPPFVSDYRPYTANQLRDVHFMTDCAKQWDTFYRNNGRNAYKDRHYILREFSQLNDALLRCREWNERATAVAPRETADGDVAESAALLSRRRGRVNDNTGGNSSSTTVNSAGGAAAEVTAGATADKAAVCLLDFGCGVGNLSLPLLEEYRDEIRVVASDLSVTGVQRLNETLQQRDLFRRVAIAFPCDLALPTPGPAVDADNAVSASSSVCRNPVAQLCVNALQTDIQEPFRCVVADGGGGGGSHSDGSPAAATINVFASLVFVLCSVKCGDWNAAARNVAESLRAVVALLRARHASRREDAEATGIAVPRPAAASASAYLFFRDYCSDDLAMHRFNPNRAVVAENETVAAAAASSAGTTTLTGGAEDTASSMASTAAAASAASTTATTTTTTFVRTNGTLSHFFTEQEVRAVFGPFFEVESLRHVTLPAPNYDVKSVDGQVNERKFIQAVLKLKL